MEETAIMTNQPEKSALTDFPVHELIRRRWSPRSFSDRKIEKEAIGSLLEAARWAASSRNEQPWRFIVARRQDQEAFDGILDTLMEGNQAWARNAGALILGVAKTDWDHSGKPNAYAWYDLGQSVAQLVAQATALGLHVHQMAGFSKERAQEELQIPEAYKPVVAIAVGYLDSPERLPEELRQRELAERSRKSLSDLVHYGRWGQEWLE